MDPFGLSPESTQDQGKTSKYEKLHNLLGTIGIFFDGADLINGFVYLAEKDYVNAAISFACGIPAVGTVVTAVAKTAKLVKYATKAAKIAKTCRDIGRIGNAAAGMKALYDTYQTAERECETTGEKIAYIAGTVITGYLIGKAANKGAEALKKFASKAIPKLKTALRENAGKLASRISKSFGSSGSGHMNRNRGYVINPFYKVGSTSFADMMSPEEAARYEAYWGRNAPDYNTPNSKITHYKEHNGIIEKSTVVYDDFGRQKWRIDYNNHGYSDHSIPHLHERDYGPGYDPMKGRETRYDIWN